MLVFELFFAVSILSLTVQNPHTHRHRSHGAVMGPNEIRYGTVSAVDDLRRSDGTNF